MFQGSRPRSSDSVQLIPLGTGQPCGLDPSSGVQHPSLMSCFGAGWLCLAVGSGTPCVSPGLEQQQCGQVAEAELAALCRSWCWARARGSKLCETTQGSRGGRPQRSLPHRPPGFLSLGSWGCSWPLTAGFFSLACPQQF